MWSWSAYLTLADELVSRTGDEAAERTAVSRAYYAVFGAAREHLVRRGEQIPKAGLAHSIVWSRFHSVPDPVHRRIADLGRILRRKRSRADYEIDYPSLTADAQTALAIAHRGIDDIVALP